MLPEYFEFTLPTRLIYGIGVLGAIGPAVAHLGDRRALLVTDEVLAKSGPADRVKQGFKNTNITIAGTFDKVPPNSTLKTVERCAAQIRRQRCDMIIAVGGGSVIDTAKTGNLLAVKGGRLADHMGANLLAKGERLLPSVIVPTTAGTGSEVTRVAVIADPEHDVKLPFTEDQFLPDLAVLDPEVTVSMPPKLTAATGMDALTHAIEAYVDKEWSPVSDALALHAVRLISGHILLACAHPEDLTARGAMLVGSFLAGAAFSHSMVGMAHAIAHALGGVYHIPHGLANAIVLPEVMAYNLPSRRERYADIAAALGVSFPQIVQQSRSVLTSARLALPHKLLDRIGPFDQWLHDRTYPAREFAARNIGRLGFVDEWVREQSAGAAVEKVRTLTRKLAYLTQIPLNLKDAGIGDGLKKLNQVAATAMEDGAMLYNPREPRIEAVKEIVKKLYFSKPTPLPVSEEELRGAAALKREKQLRQVFTDSRMLYNVLGGFYELLKGDPSIGPALRRTGLCVQFVYRNPEGIITVDARKGGLEIIQGDFDGTPEVTMTMDADFAHRFWHGKANLVSALTRRQVIARGNVPKTVKLLPLLAPAYDLYPRYLRDNGWGELVID